MASGSRDPYMRELSKIIENRNVEIDAQLAKSAARSYIIAPSHSAEDVLAWDKKPKINYTPEPQSEISVASETTPEIQPPPATAAKDSGVLSILKVNLKAMREYYSWSQRQARIICWVAVASCIIGVAVIVAAATLGFLKLFTLDQTILTAVGGMITQVFAGTTLLVYRSSVKQLNYYHKSLHEDQRFLSSVDLLWRFSKESEQDKMLAAIIRSALKINVAVATEKESDDDSDKPGKTDANGQNNNDSSADPSSKK